MKNHYSIKSKEELTDYIQADKLACFGTRKISLEKKLRNPFKSKLFKFLVALRKEEFLCFKRDNAKNIISSLILSQRIKLLDIKKNRLSLEIGVEIAPFNCGKGVRICHPNVIINGYVGENCVFHGNNVIGNKKTGDKNSVPEIGNNVDIGIGAMVIGNVTIADRCVIGAGAVVTKSFSTPETTIVGVPAKIINGEK